ncbi:UNVERIFIED_CONTAM: hypothetical protein Sindi_1278500 [Sesamum indicum]
MNAETTTNRFFFFQFKTDAYMEEAIEGGPWLFQGQLIVLQKWEPELWTEEGLSTVASGIGKPLYSDVITRACTRLDFAFVDYGLVGNRIWIAWDDNDINVHVVECGTQFIHCLVYIRSLQESIAITMICGVTEVADRRELWGFLETIATQSVDIPWLIGGDFNTMRDLSEICGASGDIRMAMEEFNGCIQNAGLLPLPMQGEWYTWHNCSAHPRNLWKRLDRLLINDRWMARFPTSF